MTTETINKVPVGIEQEDNDPNYEILRNSEVGVILAEAYVCAVNLDPRLEGIGIVPITDEDEKRHGYATPKWASESGNHEIHVRLDNLDETLDYYAKAMDASPDTMRIIAENMGIDVSMLTPQMMYVQSILHEMGHITEFMDYEDNPEELRNRTRQEKLALPLGNVTVGKLINEDSPVRQNVLENWDEVQTRTGAQSMDELITMTAVAYRGMTSETIADNFASDVFAVNPHMYDQLAQPTVDPYRNYPVAA